MHQVLYLIFNEGYSCSKGEAAIRIDLCEDAAHLCYLLCSHPDFSTPTTRALMALMLFHAARLDAGSTTWLYLAHGGPGSDEMGPALIRRAQHSSTTQPRERVSRRSISKRVSHSSLLRPQSYARNDWPAILRLYDELLCNSSVARLPCSTVRWWSPKSTDPAGGISTLEETGGTNL